jgi:hypothetical protein
MSLRCFVFRRRFLSYMEGGLESGRAGRLEKHLVGCADCAAFLARLRAGHEAGRLFGRLAPDLPSRLPELTDLRGSRPPARALSPAIAATARPLGGGAPGLAMIFVVTGPGADRTGREFAKTSIAEFPGRLRSRVVTEGFVQDVYYDREERTLHIKLAEGPSDAGPFVICEVRDARALTIPLRGSRIRVYGQARFDAQPGRGWHEVNPVMEIAVLNR